MDNYIVSARKYRPATFKSVIGQNALTTTLKMPSQTTSWHMPICFVVQEGWARQLVLVSLPKQSLALM